MLQGCYKYGKYQNKEQCFVNKFLARSVKKMKLKLQKWVLYKSFYCFNTSMNQAKIKVCVNYNFP